MLAIPIQENGISLGNKTLKETIETVKKTMPGSQPLRKDH